MKQILLLLIACSSISLMGMDQEHKQIIPLGTPPAYAPSTSSPSIFQVVETQSQHPVKTRMQIRSQNGIPPVNNNVTTASQPKKQCHISPPNCGEAVCEISCGTLALIAIAFNVSVACAWDTVCLPLTPCCYLVGRNYLSGPCCDYPYALTRAGYKDLREFVPAYCDACNKTFCCCTYE